MIDRRDTSQDKRDKEQGVRDIEQNLRENRQNERDNKSGRCDGCVVDAGAQLAALNKETSEQSKVLKKINETVSDINLALVGDLQTQGLIGRVAKQVSDLEKDIADLKKWREKTEKDARDLVGRIVAYGSVAIGILVTAAYMVMKGHP